MLDLRSSMFDKFALFGLLIHKTFNKFYAVLEGTIFNRNIKNWIMTDFGEVEINYGDWIVEINGKIKVLKDDYFKEHYEVIPDYSGRPKLVFTNDCV